jgi:hypothetical protein
MGEKGKGGKRGGEVGEGEEGREGKGGAWRERGEEVGKGWGEGGRPGWDGGEGRGMGLVVSVGEGGGNGRGVGEGDGGREGGGWWSRKQKRTAPRLPRRYSGGSPGRHGV